MKPLFFSLGNRLQLMIIPDAEAHLNGTTELCYTYSIFLDKDNRNPMQGKVKETSLHLERITDPDYYGHITFEKFGQSFTYTTDGKQELAADELEQLVEHLHLSR